MANTTPTKLGLIKSVYLLVLLVFRPNKFVEEEEKDNELRKDSTNQLNKAPRAFIVRQALISSFFLVLTSGLVGYLTGLIMIQVYPTPSSSLVTVIQVFGACTLLWGTLFVRGWDIQTYGGVTLTERANQWIYRFLYCLGTVVIVMSLVWP